MDLPSRCAHEIAREFPPELPGIRFEVADVFRRYGADYRAKHKFSERL